MIEIAQQKRRMRGEILQLLYENRADQRTRFDDVTLTGILERLRFDVSVNMIRELLQDLREREMVSFDQQKDRYTGRVTIRKIQICPAGVDIVEKTKSDPAVDME